MKLALDALPATARRIAELIGLPATLRLVEAFGGLELRLSQGIQASGMARFAEVAEVIGEDHARRLAREFRQGRVTVPLCHAAIRAAQAEAIRQEFDRLTLTDGWTGTDAVRHLVRQYRPISQRTVERYLAESPKVNIIAADQLALDF